MVSLTIIMVVTNTENPNFSMVTHHWIVDTIGEFTRAER